MPITITIDAPSRCGKVLMPTPATEPAWRPRRVSSIHSANATPSPSSACHGRNDHAAMPIATIRIRPRPRRKDLSLFMGFSRYALAPGQRIDDVEPHRAQRGQRTDQQADRDHEADTERPTAPADTGHVDDAAAAGAQTRPEQGRESQ